MLKGSKNRLKSWVRFGTAAHSGSYRTSSSISVGRRRSRSDLILSRATVPRPRDGLPLLRLSVRAVLPERRAGRGGGCGAILKGARGTAKGCCRPEGMVSCLWGGRGLAEGRGPARRTFLFARAGISGHRPRWVGGASGRAAGGYPQSGLVFCPPPLPPRPEQQHPAGPAVDPPSGLGD